MTGFGQAGPQAANPFMQLAALPADATGGRGFQTPLAAREAAKNTGVKSYAVLRAGQEYAWVSPAVVFTRRALPALLVGIALVDIQQ